MEQEEFKIYLDKCKEELKSMTKDKIIRSWLKLRQDYQHILEVNEFINDRYNQVISCIPTQKEMDDFVEIKYQQSKMSPKQRTKLLKFYALVKGIEEK